MYAQQNLYATLSFYSFIANPGTFMTDLNWSIGNTPLKGVVMPGTHDTAMYNMNGGEGSYYETQLEGDITAQLNAGARTFDFHFGYYDASGKNPDGHGMDVEEGSPSFPGIYMYGHSYTLSSYATTGLFNQVETWLVQNPSEVVLLDITANQISGGYSSNYLPDNSALFSTMLNNTMRKDLIYTPLSACGSPSCPDAVQPQNVTINQLIARGQRLIFINAPPHEAASGWAWP